MAAFTLEPNFASATKKKNKGPSLGTTIIACTYEDGVVIGADSRTSAGQYIVNRHTDKLVSLSDNIYVCESGSAADTEAIADYVSHYLNFQSMELDELSRVSSAAKLVSGFIYPNKNRLMASMIVAGYDKYSGGEIYALSLGGDIQKELWTISGSGSTYIYGICDEMYKKNMNKNDAKTFCLRALERAMFRDGYSGGIARLAFITKDGVERQTHQVNIEYSQLRRNQQ